MTTLTTAMPRLLLAACLGLGLASAAQATGLGDVLRQQAASKAGDSGASGGASMAGLSGLALPGLTSSGTAGNAAGVISYCMKNNYLSADKAGAVKDQLLGKLGMAPQQEPKDEGYLSGLAGTITGSNGKRFSLDKVKGDMKEKACDYVLDNAKSLL